MGTSNKQISGKRKLVNAAYIILTLVLVFLYIAPAPGQDIFAGIGSYFGSLDFGGSKTKLAYQRDTANKACQITGIGNYNENVLTIPYDISGYRVTSIGDQAFYNSTGFSSLQVPYSVLIIGNYAFSNCTRLEKVEITYGTEHLGSCVFMSCKNLRTVTLPSSIKSLGSFTFYDCPKLTSIHFGGTKAQWEIISVGTYWNQNSNSCKVFCSDGVVT